MKSMMFKHVFQFLLVISIVFQLANGVTIEGVNVDQLSDEQLTGLVDAVDEKFVGILDIYTGKQTLLSYSNSDKKRVLPAVVIGGRLLWIGGRYLFKHVAKRYLTKSGGRITAHYIKKGNMFTTLRHFKKLKPTNIRTYTTKHGNMYVGKVGKYQVKARPWSTYNGRPTLEIGGGRIIRKFRFE